MIESVKPGFLVTHDKRFNLNQCFSMAILTGVQPGTFEFERTSKPAVIARATLLFDMGGEYDGKTRFDGRAKDAPLRPDGKRYTTAGLVWKHFGKQTVSNALDFHQINDALCDRIADELERGMVDLITDTDVHEPGSGISLADMVADLNPPHNVGAGGSRIWPSEDNCFHEANRLVKQSLIRRIFHLHAALSRN